MEPSIPPAPPELSSLGHAVARARLPERDRRDADSIITQIIFQSPDVKPKRIGVPDDEPGMKIVEAQSNR